MTHFPGPFRSCRIVAILLFLIGPACGRKLPKLCSKEAEEAKCEGKHERVVCRGGFPHTTYSPATTVVLCFWEEGHLDPEDILRRFPYVQKLIISGGKTSEVLTDFPHSEYLETVALNGLPLKRLRTGLFSLLKNLKTLDLRHNRLLTMSEEFIQMLPPSSRVLLAGNPWDCSTDLKWVLKASNRIDDASQMHCGDNAYPGKPIPPVMHLIQSMESDCPDELCSCYMNNIVWDTSRKYLVPVIRVDCSDRSLIDLPERLPKNTTTLLLKRNNISDLARLTTNAIYDGIADIYLDDNNIRSLDVLEGADWLTKFRVLSLKGNNLEEIPTYALDNAFEKNTNLAKLYLSGNPWKCNCMFTSDFQHLLIKYRTLVKDRNEIRCAEAEEEVPVLEVSLSSVCSPDDSGINPLDVVSAILALLILLILGKLLYDYCTYKRTGKLPWLVAKMP